MCSSMPPPELEAVFGPMTQQLGHVMETTLARFGAFAPFGAGITRKGHAVHFPCQQGSEDDPDTALRRLAEELAARKFVLGIIVVNTRIVPPGTSEETDAAWWIHEERGGPIIHSFLPYKLLDDEVDYAQAFRVPDPVPMIYV